MWFRQTWRIEVVIYKLHFAFIVSRKKFEASLDFTTSKLKPKTLLAPPPWNEANVNLLKKQTRTNNYVFPRQKYESLKSVQKLLNQSVKMVFNFFFTRAYNRTIAFCHLTWGLWTWLLNLSGLVDSWELARLTDTHRVGLVGKVPGATACLLSVLKKVSTVSLMFIDFKISYMLVWFILIHVSNKIDL